MNLSASGTPETERAEASPQYATMYWHCQGQIKKVRAHPVRPDTWHSPGTHFIEPFEPDGYIHYGGPMTLGSDLFSDKSEAVACASSYLQGIVASAQAKLAELALIESGELDVKL